MNWPLIFLSLVLFAVLDAMAILLWYACADPRSQFFGPALTRGRADGRRVAVTFDDGPAPPFTEQILDILKEHKVKANFFVCGKDAECHPATLRRIAAEGHVVGNHTFSHPYLFLMRKKALEEEIDRAQEAIEKITGRRPIFFRPPYGVRWFGLASVLRQRGMKMVLWSASGEDWKNNTAGIVRASLRNLVSGSVLLLHDGQQAPGGILKSLFRRAYGTFGLGRGEEPSISPVIDRTRTVAALPQIIDHARKAGLEFVSIEGILSSP